MFLALQFPFADARQFVAQAGGRLDAPSWPIATTDKDFIRSSGLVRPRALGGIGDWAGEELYGNAQHALKFPDHLGDLPIVAKGATASLRCVYRRFFSDGVVARLEVGLKLDLDAQQPAPPLDLLALTRQVLDIEVRAKGSPASVKPVKLLAAGPAMARHFLKATTNFKKIPGALVQPWWLTAGTPSILIEYSGRAIDIPHARSVLDAHDGTSAGVNAELSHAWLQLGTQRCGVWLLKMTGVDTDATRRLRIHLVRLHAERECLKCLLSHLSRKDRLAIERDSPFSDAIQAYLGDALRLLNKPARFGFDQTATLAAAQYAFGAIFEGETASLEKMRRQTAEQVAAFIRKAQNTSSVINNIQGNYMSTSIQMGNVQVTGDFNVVTAANIQNSFNKAANADVNGALKEQLKQLATQVAELAKKLPPDEAEQVSQDLQTLTAESVSKKPRKAQYELSGDGLIAAAKTVAEMAAPITVAVKAVLALLA